VWGSGEVGKWGSGVWGRKPLSSVVVKIFSSGLPPISYLLPAVPCLPSSQWSLIFDKLGFGELAPNSSGYRSRVVIVKIDKERLT